MLWETVHVYFEHREQGHDVGVSSFLYPFPGREEQRLEKVVEEVQTSMLQKMEEVNGLRVATARTDAESISEVAVAISERLDRGGKILSRERRLGHRRQRPARRLREPAAGILCYPCSLAVGGTGEHHPSPTTSARRRSSPVSSLPTPPPRTRRSASPPAAARRTSSPRSPRPANVVS